MTPRTIAHQAPLSMGFSRQEYWSRLPFPSPRDLPDPGVEPGSPSLQGDSLLCEPPGKPCECLITFSILSIAQVCVIEIQNHCSIYSMKENMRYVFPASSSPRSELFISFRADRCNNWQPSLYHFIGTENGVHMVILVHYFSLR